MKRILAALAITAAMFVAAPANAGFLLGLVVGSSMGNQQQYGAIGIEPMYMMPRADERVTDPLQMHTIADKCYFIQDAPQYASLDSTFKALMKYADLDAEKYEIIQVQRFSLPEHANCIGYRFTFIGKEYVKSLESLSPPTQ